MENPSVDWLVLAFIGILLVALVVFLVARNFKDKRQLEKKLEQEDNELLKWKKDAGSIEVNDE